MTEKSKPDIEIAKNHNLKEMERLRSNLMSKFRGLWTYIYKVKEGSTDLSTSYQLTVSNRWGGKLNEQEITEVRKLAKDFINNNQKLLEAKKDKENS